VRFDWARGAALLLVTLVLAAEGCAGRGGSGAVVPAVMLQTPKSVSPGSVSAPPMPQTALRSSSEMAARHPSSDIQALGWSQLSGAAVFVTAAPDGSIWVLSPDGPSGGRDKYIYHYANGSWTNVPGWATRLAVAPDGTLWAVNSTGGIYAYNGTWRTMAGGASDVSIGPDGSIYVVSDAPGGPDGRGIWHFTGGNWSQLPGAAVRIAASADPGTYPGGIGPGGFWVTNAFGSIYYYNPASGYHQVSGGAAEVQPTKNGGLFALGAPPASPNGNPIYYNNLATGSWTQEPGSGVSLATDGTHVYAVGHEGGIYSALVSGSAPVTAGTAPVAGYLAKTASGSFAGQLRSTSSIATLVGISTSEVAGGPSTSLGVGQLAFNLGSTALSAGRLPASVAAPAVPSGPRGYPERAVAGPQELDALLSRLRPVTSTVRDTASTRRTSSLGTTVGSTNAFWVSTFAIGTSGGSDKQVTSTLRAVANNGYVWVDDTLSLDAATVSKIADDLDNAYASDTAHYGQTSFTTSAPGEVNHPPLYQGCDSTGTVTGVAPRWVVPPDSRINVFVINVATLGTGVGGYFSSNNYFAQRALNCLIGQGYTAQTVPHSNEAPMIYVGWNAGNPVSFETDEDLVRGTAHELQHLINFVNHVLLSDGSSEDAWINEGMSMLAQDFAANRKFGIAHDSDAMFRARDYLNAPENFSLSAFTGQDANTSAPSYNCSGCYGAEYLFQRYLYDRFGGDAYLHGMLGYNTRHWALESATGTNEQQVFSDFAIAMAASGTNTTSDPRFTIGSLNLRGTFTDQFNRSLSLSGPQVHALPSSATPYFGSFVYYYVGASANGQTISVKDVNGNFGLQAGIVQQ
jgi:hypothetical protein